MSDTVELIATIALIVTTVTAFGSFLLLFIQTSDRGDHPRYVSALKKAFRQSYFVKSIFYLGLCIGFVLFAYAANYHALRSELIFTGIIPEPKLYLYSFSGAIVFLSFTYLFTMGLKFSKDKKDSN